MGEPFGLDGIDQRLGDMFLANNILKPLGTPFSR
jgi:hypothetical protein